MKTSIHGLVLDEERALYHLQDALVSECTFAGEADGESALKEARNIRVEKCDFRLRYPLWHADSFTLSDSRMTDTCRAAVWYARNGRISECSLDGIKAFRECDELALSGCTIHSPELGWRCRGISLDQCDVTSEYFLFESRDISIQELSLHGKYSFQYTENVTVRHSVLNTKDAFWHAKNVTVEDSVVQGEYLGWYSDSLTLIRCRINGTQPFCYCRNLKLIDCTMENTDLAFEYSDVEADITGTVLSVKNPRSGRITADGYGEILREDAVYDCSCQILTR